MHIYLSTLTEVDYKTSLNSIENNYNLNPESSWQDRARVKNLRKLESYNYELEVIAKNELNEVIGHVVLAEVKLSSKNKKAIALAIGALSVDKSIRNQGLGQALLKAVEERAKEQGYCAIFVNNHPQYFEKSDYEAAHLYNIHIEEKRNHQSLLVKFLKPVQNEWSGMTVYYPEVLD